MAPGPSPFICTAVGATLNSYLICGIYAMFDLPPSPQRGPCAALLLIILLLPASISQAAIYKIINPDGSVSYSDKPGTGAQRVDLPPVNTTPAPTLLPRSDPPAADATTAYTLAIVAPPSGTQLLPDQPDLLVSVQITPALADGHLLQAQLNGSNWGAATRATDITLIDIPRGEHQVQIAVTDPSGAILARSPGITVQAFKPSINLPTHPNNPANRSHTKSPNDASNSP